MADPDMAWSFALAVRAWRNAARLSRARIKDRYELFRGPPYPAAALIWRKVGLRWDVLPISWRLQVSGRGDFLWISYGSPPAFASSFDPGAPDIPASASFAVVGAGANVVTDLIYLALGCAVLAVFGLYAFGLKRV